MTAPNLVEASTTIGDTVVYGCTVSLSEVLANAANSNTVYKISSIRAVNVASSTVTVDVSIYRSSTHRYQAKDYSLTAKSIFSVLDKNEYLWLREGDALYAKSNTASAIDLTITYEVLG